MDLINKFGTLNGFQILHDRFMSGQALNVQIIAALIKYSIFILKPQILMMFLRFIS